MRNFIRTVSAAAVALAAFGVFSALGADGVTKKRLGSLKRDDLVVTDVSGVPGGGGGSYSGVDTNAVKEIVKEYDDTVVVPRETGSSRRYVAVSKPARLGPYLWEMGTVGEDFTAATNRLATAYPSYGRCTGVCTDRYHGRNLDWIYDSNATIVVRSPAREGKLGVIGVVGGAILDSALDSCAWDEKYVSIPFTLSDGINDRGVVIQQNVIPRDLVKSAYWHMKRPNSIISFAMIRYALDRCTNAYDAAVMIRDRTFIPEEFDFDFHFMVSDRTSSYIVEDGTIYSSSVIPTDVMTNFRVGGLSTNENGTVSWSSIESTDPYGIGIERYDRVRTNGYDKTTVSGMLHTMVDVWYSKAYDPSTSPYWYTEHCDKTRTVFSVASAKSNHGIFASEIVSWHADYIAEHNPENARYRGGSTWQTVHTSVYDKDRCTLVLLTQENPESVVFFRLNADQEYTTPEEVSGIISEDPVVVDIANRIDVSWNTLTNNCQFATDIWTTVSSYIPYLESFAESNKYASLLANYRAKRLEFWQDAVSNDLLLASGTNGLKNSPYFSITNEQLVATVTNQLVADWALYGNTRPVTDLSSRTTFEEATGIVNDIVADYRPLSDNVSHSAAFSKWVISDIPEGYTLMAEQPFYISGWWGWVLKKGSDVATFVDLAAREDATTLSLSHGTLSCSATRDLVAEEDDTLTTYKYVDSRARFTKNIKATANIGVHEVDSSKGYVELSLAGKTIEEGLRYIFAETKPPEAPTYPSITSVTLSNAGGIEVGRPFSPSYSVSANTGSYTFDSSTGVSYDQFVIYDSLYRTNRVNSSSTTPSGSFESFTVTDNTSYRVYVKAHHGKGARQHDNQGVENPSDSLRIASRWCCNKASEAGADVYPSTSAVTGYRPWFYFSGVHNTNIDAYFVTNTATKRMNGSVAMSAKSLPADFVVNVAAGHTLVAVAIPKYNATYGYTKEVTDVIDYSGGFNLSVFTDVKTKDVDITVAGVTLPYRVWYYAFADGMSSTTFTFKFTTVSKASFIPDSLQVQAMASPASYNSSAPLLVNMYRQYRNPLDSSSLFYSKADLDYYTTTGRLTSGVSSYWSGRRPYPYSGQIVTLAPPGQTATNYMLRAKDDGEFSLSAIFTATEIKGAFATESRVDELEDDIGRVADDVTSLGNDALKKSTGGTVLGDLKVKESLQLVDAVQAIPMGLVGAPQTNVTFGLDGISRRYVAGSSHGATSSDYTFTYPSASGTILLDSDVVTSLDGDVSGKVLSASKGKDMQEQIANLQQRGRYLSVWNAISGSAMTLPPENPYIYHSGDYFVVGFVTNTVNYKPVGGEYDTNDVAHAVEPASDIKVNDTYYYDGTSWTLLSTEQKEITIGSVAGLSDALASTNDYLRSDAQAADSALLGGNSASYFAPAVIGGYLPKSGGTVSGDTTVNATLSIGSSTPKTLRFGGGDSVAGSVTASENGRTSFAFTDYTGKTNSQLHVDGSPVITENTGDARYLGKTATASDADKLDGHDSSYFATAVSGGYLAKSGGTMSGDLDLAAHRLDLGEVWVTNRDNNVAFVNKYATGQPQSVLTVDGSPVMTKSATEALISASTAPIRGGANISVTNVQPYVSYEYACYGGYKCYTKERVVPWSDETYAAYVDETCLTEDGYIIATAFGSGPSSDTIWYRPGFGGNLRLIMDNDELDPVVHSVGVHSLVSFYTDDGSDIVTANTLESTLSGKNYAKASQLTYKADSAIVDHIYTLSVEVLPDLVCYSRDGKVSGVTNVVYKGASVPYGYAPYNELVGYLPAGRVIMVYTNGLDAMSGLIGTSLRFYRYEGETFAPIVVDIGDYMSNFDNGHISSLVDTVKKATPIYSSRYSADTKKFDGKSYDEAVSDISSRMSSDIVRTYKNGGAWKMKNGNGMVIDSGMVGAVYNPSYTTGSGDKYLKRNNGTYTWSDMEVTAYSYVTDATLSGTPDSSGEDRTFQWCMYGNDLGVPSPGSTVYRIRLRMAKSSGLTDKQRKLLVFDNNGGAHNDTCNKVVALSDNFVSMNVGNDLWVDFTFSQGFTVSSGHRIILVPWFSGEAWANVSNITWTAALASENHKEGRARFRKYQGAVDGNQVWNPGVAYKYRPDTVFTCSSPHIDIGSWMSGKYVTAESDPTVPDWAKAATPPNSVDDGQVKSLIESETGGTNKLALVSRTDSGSVTSLVVKSDVSVAGFTGNAFSSHYVGGDRSGMYDRTGAFRFGTLDEDTGIPAAAYLTYVGFGGELTSKTSSLTPDGTPFLTAGSVSSYTDEWYPTKTDMASAIQTAVNKCNNYWLTNFTGRSFTLPSGYIGTVHVGDLNPFTVSVSLSLPTDTRFSGDCALRIISSGASGTGTLKVTTAGSPSIVKSVIGVDPSEIYPFQEAVYYMSRIGYESGTNVILVTRQPIYQYE